MLGIERRGDVDDAIDQLRAAGEVIFFRHAVRLESGGEVLGQVQFAARHPTSRFDSLGSHIMVGIFLVLTPRVVAENRIDAQEPK